MHPNSMALFNRYALEHFYKRVRVLEIGPNAFPSAYQYGCKGRYASWDTLDIGSHPKLTYKRSNPYKFEIPDNRYDIVLSGQVIEHVPRPWVWMREVARVTTVGGLVITIAPVSWKYHKCPVDCWRIYPDGMNALYEHAGIVPIYSTFTCLAGSAVDTIAIGRKP
jgi:SAM-dependent methyltransferase